MSSVQEQIQEVANAEKPPIQVPFRMLAAAVKQRRLWLAMVTLIGGAFIVGLTFIGPNEYQSTARLMPPDSTTFSGRSMLNSMMGSLSAASLIMPDLGGGGLLSGRSPGATTIGILGSDTVEDDIINRFNLLNVYHRKLYVDARKDLIKASGFSEDKKSGIITISVEDEDPNRARAMAQSYIDELDKLANNLSSSAARRERIFLEGRLKSIKDELDFNTQALSQFSSHNATMDPQKQGEATVEAAEKVQGELILAQSQLSGLKAIYTDDNARVRGAQNRVDELQRQFSKMAGSGANAGTTGAEANPAFPSVRALPLLGVTYYDLYRKVTTDEALYEALTKQYELAKVGEAEDIVPVRVLDPPLLPERRLPRHRVAFLIFGLVLSALAGFVWIVVREFVRVTDHPHPVRALVLQFLRSVKSEDSEPVD